MRSLAAAVLFTGLLLPSAVHAGGVHPSLRGRLQQRFRADAGCEDRLDMESQGAGLVQVTGCGKVAKYVCDRVGTCVLQEMGKTRAQAASDALRAEAKEAKLAKLRPRVEQETHSDGYPILRAILPAEHIEMRITTAPTKDATQVLWTVRFKDKRENPDAECQHALVANGAGLTLTEVKKVSDGERDEFRFKLPIQAFTQLAAADRVVGRTCELRWQLNDASLSALRELVVRFHETIALEGGSTPTAAPAADKTSL